MTRKNLTEMLRASDLWEEDGNYDEDGERFENTEEEIFLVLEQTEVTLVCYGMFSMGFKYNELIYDNKEGIINLRKSGHIAI